MGNDSLTGYAEGLSLTSKTQPNGVVRRCLVEFSVFKKISLKKWFSLPRKPCIIGIFPHIMLTPILSSSQFVWIKSVGKFKIKFWKFWFRNRFCNFTYSWDIYFLLDASTAIKSDKEITRYAAKDELFQVNRFELIWCSNRPSADSVFESLPLTSSLVYPEYTCTLDALAVHPKCTGTTSKMHWWWHDRYWFGNWICRRLSLTSKSRANGAVRRRLVEFSVLN